MLSTPPSRHRQSTNAIRSARTLEILLAYPGLHALLVPSPGALAVDARRFSWVAAPRRSSRFITGIEIHPGAASVLAFHRPRYGHSHQRLWRSARM